MGALRLPRISNFTDLDPLEFEPDMGISLVEIGDKLGKLDALIIPGTRNTVSDMLSLNETGYSDEIVQISREIPVFGICGGYQIMGNKIIDESQKESKYGTVEGLGILKLKTSFGQISKIIRQSSGEVLGGGIFHGLNGNIVNGYELHEGISILNGSKPLLRVLKGCGNNPSSYFDGAVDGESAGTYFHGIFHNFLFRRYFTDYLRGKKGLEKMGYSLDHFEVRKGFSLERLADIFEKNIDMKFIDQILGL